MNFLNFVYPNEVEFAQTFEDVFGIEEYAVVCDKEDPYIVDCGCHVGLSIAYFKSKFPNCTIIGFEPNPNTFEYLKKNVAHQGYENVSLHQNAISVSEAETSFYVNSEGAYDDWSINTSLLKGKGDFGDQREEISVKTVSLVPLLSMPVDILKIDIQGFETMVLQQIAPQLSFVSELLLEYHGKTDEPFNDLATIVSILRERYQHVEIKQEGKIVDIEQAIADDLHWIIIHGW